MPQAQQLAIQIRLEGSNQVVSAIQQVHGQFTSFTQTLEAGFQLNLGAKLADTVLRALGAFRSAIDEGLRYAASLKDMSIQSGLTTAAIQVLGHSAEQSGASIENVRSALTNLRQAATAAQAGNAELANAFARLGVDAQKITTLPLADQLEAIARGFAASGGDGQAFAALIRVLGERDAPRLQALLQSLASEGLGGMARALHQTGALLSSELVEKADAIDDRWGALKTKFKVTFAELGVALEPVISLMRVLAGLALDMLKAIRGIGQGLGAIMAGLIGGVKWRDALEEWRAMFEGSIGDLHGQPMPTAGGVAEIAGGAAATGGSGRQGPGIAEMRAEQSRLALAMQPLWQQREAAVAAVTAAERDLQRVIDDGNRKGRIDTQALMEASLAVTRAKTEAWQIDKQINAELERQQQQNAQNEELEASMLPLSEQHERARARLAEAEAALAALLADEQSTAQTLLDAEGARLRAKQALVALDAQAAQAAARQAADRAESEARRLAAERARLEGDFTRTDAEKWAERRRLLQEEIRNQAELVRVLQERRDLALQAGDTAGAAIYEQSGRSAGRDLDQLANQYATLGPDPNSFVEQLRAGLASLRAEWGTTAQQVAGAIRGTISGAVQSVSQQLTQWVLRAQSFREALGNIRLAIVQEIIGAIVSMGVRWVANLAMMAARWVATRLGLAAAEKSIAAASVAATLPVALAQSALWATPATLATIATFGAAAAAAPGFITASTVATKALALFEAGGYTAGRRGEIAGLVHGEEFVFSAPAVDALGRDSLASLHAAALAGERPAATAPGSGATPAAGPRPLLILPVYDMQSALREQMRHPDFEVRILDLMRRRRGELLES